MLNINYVVNVNWLDFTFNEPYQAMQFAKSAMEHIEENNHTRVSIDLHIVPDEISECCECCECCECEEEVEKDDEQ